MKSKMSLKLSLLSTGLIIITLFFLIILFPTAGSSDQDADISLTSVRTNYPTQSTKIAGPGNPNQFTFGLPLHIEIPKIKTNADIEQVGMTLNGAMAAPTHPTDAAWYDTGPRPGDIGSAVIDGHFGIWKSGQKAVFNDLDKLSKGDLISIIDDRDAIINFAVIDIRTYAENADTSDIFNSNDGKAHLNLITCGGDWNSVTKSYSKRIVVFSDQK